MARNITEYDLLISCPTDIEKELEIIKDTVSNFNRNYGEVNNVSVKIKHWSSDAYPQSNGRAQQLLNSQFVKDCDMVVAVFWTKFGTPTGEFDSGTEEEIRHFLDSNKQVFMYFSDVPAKPSSYDKNQYIKVQEFKNKYKEKGLYWIYESHEEFSRLFLNHLTKHFINTIVSIDNLTKKSHNSESQLKLCGVDSKKLVAGILLKQTSLANSGYMNSIFEKIKSLYHQISQIILEHVYVVDLKGRKSNLDFITGHRYKVDDLEIVKIMQFADIYSIDIKKDEFFELGDLKQHYNFSELTSKYGGSTYEFRGTEEEKKKHKFIGDLLVNIDLYLGLIDYFSQLDQMYYSELCISNYGSVFDEDVDLKIIIEDGEFCKLEMLPEPSESIKGLLAKNMEVLLTPKRFSDVYSYPIDEEIKNLENYSQKLMKYYPYILFREENEIILEINFNYIKQNTNVFMPSYLFFKKVPSILKYKITSKHNPKVVEGELSVLAAQT